MKQTTSMWVGRGPSTGPGLMVWFSPWRQCPLLALSRPIRRSRL